MIWFVLIVVFNPSKDDSADELLADPVFGSVLGVIPVSLKVNERLGFHSGECVYICFPATSKENTYSGIK